MGDHVAVVDRGVAGERIDSRESESAGAAFEESAGARDVAGDGGGVRAGYGQGICAEADRAAEGEVAGVGGEECVFRKGDAGVDRLGVGRIGFDIAREGDRVVGDREGGGSGIENDPADGLVGDGIDGGLGGTSEMNDVTGNGQRVPVVGSGPTAIACATGPSVVRGGGHGLEFEVVAVFHKITGEGEIADGVVVEVGEVEAGNAISRENGEVAGGVAEIAEIKDNGAVESGCARGVDAVAGGVAEAVEEIAAVQGDAADGNGVDGIDRAGAVGGSVLQDECGVREVAAHERAGVDGGGAGVGVRAVERERAGAVFGDRAGAGDVAGEGAVGGLVEGEGGVVRDVAGDGVGGNGERASGDRGAAGVGAGAVERERAAAGFHEAV